MVNGSGPSRALRSWRPTSSLLASAWRSNVERSTLTGAGNSLRSVWRRAHTSEPAPSLWIARFVRPNTSIGTFLHVSSLLNASQLIMSVFCCISFLANGLSFLSSHLVHLLSVIHAKLKKVDFSGGGSIYIYICIYIYEALSKRITWRYCFTVFRACTKSFSTPPF